MFTRQLLTIIVFSLVIFVMISPICTAQEWSRKGKGELFGLGQSMSGDTTSGLGITMKLGDTTVGGFGFGYNYNDNLNLNWDMFFGSTEITNKGFGVTLKSDSTLIGLDLNLEAYILKSRFTPMLIGGIGWINFSGDVEGFPFNETDFSYNFGAGFRWDITDHLLIKGIYRSTSTKWRTLTSPYHSMG